MYDFSVDYNSIYKSDILNIHKYLMVKNNINIIIKFIRQVFIVSWSFSKSLVTKYVSLYIKPCLIRPTFLDLHPVRIKYYPFLIALDKCTGNCKSVDDLSPKYVFRVKQKT